MNPLRNTLHSIAVVALLAIATAPRAAAADSAKPTIVIVHGAWGGGWAFNEVDTLLTADGYKVYRPTLTGQGEHSNLSSTNIHLGLHIQDIVNVILWEKLTNIVLVGHSYGGMVVTGVADRVPDRIKRLVYLDAFLPENGESVDALIGKTGPNSLKLTVSNGYVLYPNFTVNKPLPHDVPMPAKTFSEPISLKNQDAARKISTHYILTVDPGKQPQEDTFFMFYERAKARGWTTEIMEGDHNVQWSRPKQLVTLLEKAALEPRP